ncbi:unnamed protein product [Diamesa serratosioi]
MSRLANFKGVIAPVFTPFLKDSSINYEVIHEYAGLLKSKGVSAFLVNGTTGEGMSLSVAERKKVTEKWMEVCKKIDNLVMVQISGCPLPDVVELAKHASALKVDGILCLPELYFKPKSISQLVDYMKNISTHCQDIPLYYYHMPKNTQVDLNMGQFMEKAKKEIPNFCGIKYTSGDLDQGYPCLEHGQVFLGSASILCGALALGFDSAIMTLLNLEPEICIKIVELMKAQKVDEARKQQQLLNKQIKAYLEEKNLDWVPAMKSAFNKKFSSVDLGICRKPFN